MRIIFALLIICIVGCYGEDKTKVRPIVNVIRNDLTKVEIKNDTVFIVKERVRGDYHAVFVDTNRHSEFRNRLVNFKVPKFYIDSYSRSLQLMKSSCLSPVKPSSNYNLPNNLLPINTYKSSWYLYAPSDWGNAGRRILTDSTFVIWQMDGMFPYPIISRKQTTANIIELKIAYCDRPNGGQETILIHLDKVDKGIFKFEFPERLDNDRFEWYTSVENEKYFDLIVNYSKNTKWVEY